MRGRCDPGWVTTAPASREYAAAVLGELSHEGWGMLSSMSLESDEGVEIFRFPIVTVGVWQWIAVCGAARFAWFSSGGSRRLFLRYQVENGGENAGNGAIRGTQNEAL